MNDRAALVSGSSQVLAALALCACSEHNRLPSRGVTEGKHLITGGLVFSRKAGFPKTSASLLLSLLLTPLATAQLNWEGQTGGLITPFAYTSSSSMGIARPLLALHYLHGGEVVGNDFQISITTGFLKIAEGGFTRTFNVQGADEMAPLFANGFNSGHIKFRLLRENAGHTSFTPAVAAGAIVRTQVRRVTEVTERENTTATDFFLVGTKTVANLRV